MKYSEKDVIWKNDDPRICLHMRCKVGENPYDALATANDSSYLIGELVGLNTDSSEPFKVRFSTGSRTHTRSVACIIKVDSAEEDKKYVPYDLSKKEVRDKLRDKWVVKKGIGFEIRLNHFNREIEDYDEWFADSYSAKELLKDFVFLETGLPVGELVTSR